MDFMKRFFALLTFTAAALACAAQQGATAQAAQTNAAPQAAQSAAQQTQTAAKPAQTAQETPSEQLLEKLKSDSMTDSKNLHMFMRGIVKFTRNNISEKAADFLLTKVCGIRIVSIVAISATAAFAWILQHYIIAFAFSLFLREKNGKSVRDSRRILARLRSPVSWFVILVAGDSAVLLLTKNPDVAFLTRRVSTVLFFFLLSWALKIFSDAVFKMFEEKMAKKYVAAKNLLTLGNQITKYTIYTISFLVILDTLGANITAVVASLGIGGAALAFASKDTIANFFGSVSLIVDRPFIVGDWITAAGVEGVVEFIGFRSTRIRTFPRTVVSIPNSVLANATVENWSKRNKRRYSATLGMTYSATPEQMEAIVEDIKTILRNNSRVDQSDIRVSFSGFGDSSLDISVLYYLFDISPIPFAEDVQKINLDIMRAVQKRGLSFAFPSRSIYVESVPPSFGK